VKASDGAETVTAAAEFLLEGMCAHRRISRNEERNFSAQRKAQEKPERMEKADPERDYEQWQTKRSRRGSFN
jgi:magnesium chelatase subunit I